MMNRNFLAGALAVFAFQAAHIFADEVATYLGQSGLSSTGGDGTPVVIWADQGVNSTDQLLPQNSPVFRASGSGNETGAVEFSASGLDEALVSANSPSPLSGANEFTAVIVFSPDGDGESDATPTEFTEVSALLSSYSGLNSDGWGLGYSGDRVYFGVTDATGFIATVSTPMGRPGAGEWWVAVARWKSGDTPEISINLYDGTGALQSSAKADPNVLTSSTGRFREPRVNSSLSVGGDGVNPSDRNFDGKVALIRLFNTHLTNAETAGVVQASAINSAANLFTVSSGNDSGVGTLRDAIIASNASPGPDVIAFHANGLGSSVVLNSGDITISGTVRILGGSIDAAGTVSPLTPTPSVDTNRTSRVFRVASAGRVLIEGLNFTDSKCPDGENGGAILNLGNTTIRNARFFSNQTGINGSGGALSNEKVLVVEDCEFLFNKAANSVSGSGAGNGGAIANFDTNATLQVLRCDFTQNLAGNGTLALKGGGGGAIFGSNSSIEVVDSTFTANRSGLGGDPASTAAAGNGGDGGAIMISGTGSLVVVGSTFSSNEAEFGGFNTGGGANGNPGNGGAIFVAAADHLEVTCSTFTQNLSSGLGSAVSADGADYLHCTITANTGSSAVFDANRATVTNSIISGNAQSLSEFDVVGDLEVIGNNIVESHQFNNPNTGAGSISVGPPELEALADNGGPTQTMQPLPGSVAVNGGSFAGTVLPLTDQRGGTRVFGSAPDIGAVEVLPQISIEGFPGDGVEDRSFLEFRLVMTVPDPVNDTSVLVSTPQLTTGGAQAGVDYVNQSVELTIPAGELERSFRVQMIDDALPEQDESFRVLVEPLPGGNVNQIRDSFVFGTIFDDDSAVDFANVPGSAPVLPGIVSSGPLVGAAGTYFGLIRDDANTDSILGNFTSLKISDSGVFSATVLWKGESAKIKGVFDPVTFQSPPFLLTFKSGAQINLTLTLGRKTSTDYKIEAVIQDGPVTAGLDAIKGIYDGKNLIAPEAGRYTMLMPLPQNLRGQADTPQGDGFGAVNILPNGKVLVSGKLADGSVFSRSSMLSGDGEWGFYLPLYASKPVKGFFAGTLLFRAVGGVSDFDGRLHWRKFADTREKRYPTGFDFVSHGIGSVYFPPASGTRALGSLSNSDHNCRLYLGEGDLANGDLAKILSWDDRNRILFFGPEKIATKVNTSNGLLSGSYSDGLGTKVSYAGVIFGKQSLVSGYFLNGVKSGHMKIEPGGGFDYPGSTSGGSGELLTGTGGVTLSSGTPVLLSPAAAGVYYGLLHNPAQQVSGRIVSLKLSANGGFSLVYEITGSGKVSVKGVFNAAGEFVGLGVTKTKLYNVNLELTELNSPTGLVQMVEGTIVPQGGGTTHEVAALKNQFNKKTNPSPKAGRYTIYIDNSAGSSSDPQGNGYALVLIGTDGKVTTSGTLGDRTRFTSVSFLSIDQFWTNYAALYRTNPKGFVAGRFRFTSPGSDQISGEVDWRKQPDTREKFYSAGFNITRINSFGGRYTPPSSGMRAVRNLSDGFHNARLVFEFPGAATDELILTWDSKNKILEYTRATGAITANVKTGEIKGAIVKGGVKSIFSGAIFQAADLSTKDDLIKGSHQTGTGEPDEMTLEAR